MDIHKLLQPLFDEFQERCVKLKSDKISQCIDEIKMNEMNLCAFDDAPSKKQFIRTFTTLGVFGAHGWTVEIDDERIKKILKSEQWRISKDCKEYAKKLEQKIDQKLKGEQVASMTLEGSLWEQSSVKVTVESGRIITFVTKTIVNKTKYGDYFFQFPTRVQRV